MLEVEEIGQQTLLGGLQLLLLIDLDVRLVHVEQTVDDGDHVERRGDRKDSVKANLSER